MYDRVKWTLFFCLIFPQVVTAENLYKSESYRALTADHRAYQIGDILTILILETSSATATAGTTTDKNSDTAIKFSSPVSQKNYSAGFQNNFDGSGKIVRSGKLLAQLSVSITGIKGNGDLIVKGDQSIEINGEKQAISLEGRIRPQDIDENNSIVSNRVADAHITYIGDGILAENQQKGWLLRLVGLLGFLL